ncbi:MAG: MFS transporter [Dehalococcoidia bacterium]|nr:MFS transporter [Dehalococcoidia bacterium]
MPIAWGHRISRWVLSGLHGTSYFLSSLIFGRQSDMRGRLVFIRTGLGLASVAYLLQIIASGPITLLMTRAAVGFCLGIASPAVMAYVYEAQGRVGNFASYGSLGWLFGALLAALLRNYESLFFSSAVASALAFLMALTLSERGFIRSRAAAFPFAAARADRKLYFAFFLRQIGAYAVWSIFPLYLVSIGASKLWVAILDAINMGGQFIIMRYIERFNAAKIFTLGLITSAFAFAIYGIANHYLQIIPVQIMLALSWSCLFVGAMSFLLKRSLEHGTAAGLLYSSMYSSAGIGPGIGGALSQAWGFSSVMLFGSAMTFIGFLSSRGLAKTEGKPDLKE